MVIVPLLPDQLDVRSVSAQTDPELLGWSVRRSTNSKPVPATTVVHTKNGSGTQNFLTRSFRCDRESQPLGRCPIQRT